MISPAPYQVSPAARIRSKTFWPFGSVWLMHVVGGHHLGTIAGDPHQVGIDAQLDEVARGALAVRKRDEVEFGLCQAVAGDRFERGTLGRRGRSGHGTSSSPARRTGTRRRVLVSTERSSPRRPSAGMGRVSRSAASLVRAPDGPTPHRTSLPQDSPHRTYAELVWDDGTNHSRTAPDSKEKSRWPPSDAPRPPGPAP